MKLEVLRIMNNASFGDRLVRDVNFSISKSNIEIANSTIAVNRPFKSQDGEYQADFINFVGFRNTAKILNQYTAKGNQVGMSGRMQSRTYENKQGQTVHVTELVVENVTLLDSNRDNDNQDGIHSQSQTNQSRGGYGGSTGYQGGNQSRGQGNNYQNNNQSRGQGNNYQRNNQHLEQNPFNNADGPVDISDSDLPF